MEDRQKHTVQVDTIEKLCEPFLRDEKIGLTGGAPIPVNDPNTFLGYIIHAWWWFHRNIPRFGEIIAYRNILSQYHLYHRYFLKKRQRYW